MKFSETPFDERLLRGIQELGFEECTPVQAETFRAILEGRDVLAQSQTGTGKTAAFLISGFHLMLGTFQGKKLLVLAPTRELADQIEKEARAIGKYLPFKIGCFYGGVGYAHQERLLQEGVDVIIGTPGRILDFLAGKKLDLSSVGIAVVDEADRMFDMGFLPDVRKILRRLPPPEQRRTMMFSATLNTQVGYLAWEFMREPAEIFIEPEKVAVETITQELYHVAHEEKMSLLLGLLKKFQPSSAVFFVNTKQAAVKLAKRLRINGYPAEYLIGDMPQSQRLKVIKRFKDKSLSWLVATDVASRGLHIEDLDLVVNYDLPLDPETYVHRIGRTARCGKSGRAVSLACEKYVFGLKAIEDYIGFKIPVRWVEESELVEDKSAGVDIPEDDHPPRAQPVARRGRGKDQRPALPKVAELVAQAAGSRSRSPRSNKSRTSSPARSSKTSSRTPPITAAASLEDRLAYYRQKYGAEFEKARAAQPVAAHGVAAESPKALGEPADNRKAGERRRRRRRRRGKREAAAPVTAAPPENASATVQKPKTGLLGKFLRFLFGRSRKE